MDIINNTCGGYSSAFNPFTRQFEIVFFCGTRATTNLEIVEELIGTRPKKLKEACEELILNHVCNGRPTGVLPDVR